MKQKFLLLLLLAAGNMTFAQSGKAIRILLVGGGASHDFDRWYRQADAATLEKDGFATVTYTDQVDSVLPLLPQADVLLLSNNQPMEDPQLRQAIFDFVASGKGLVLAHAATWYNWADWPEYNKELVGGGSRGHDRYGKFEVSIAGKHPITRKVEKQFSLEDELYHIETDAEGPGMKILATGKAGGSDKVYPVLWITPHPKARIVGFTLGHDAKSHDLPAYQTILRNAVKWAAGK
ncbi:MAG TPA: ThuA domain-containing protein [Anseongella sp.]|nr:ThuA domain-containing protein [Anseongella sp.]